MVNGEVPSYVMITGNPVDKMEWKGPSLPTGLIIGTGQTLISQARIHRRIHKYKLCIIYGKNRVDKHCGCQATVPGCG